MTDSPNPISNHPVDVAIVGGGPAGLMAAQTLQDAGYAVHLYDAMPTVGRKFLLAGKGGLNLTHSEGPDAFAGRYGARRGAIEALLQGFDASALREWVHGLGVETFVGSRWPCVPQRHEGGAFAARLAAPPAQPCGHVQIKVCSFICATVGPDGRRMVHWPLKRHRAGCKCRPAQPCWR